MIIVNDINSTQFEINGIRYFKNFTPVVRNNFISISNTYGSNITLCEFTHFNQFEVNGVIYASVQETQIALLPILFTRVSLIDIQNTLPDGLLSSGTITVVGQNVNFSTGFNARIQGVLVSNNAQSFTLPLAVNSRFDSFGINNLGVIIRIAGDDQENPFLPNIPANVIYITSVLVSSTSVGQPTAPELTGFVQKIYSNPQEVSDVSTFELPSNGSTYFRFIHQNGNLNFNGFTNANNNPELFEGKDFYIENQSDFTLTLTTGAGIRPADALTIPARKLAHYKYRSGKLYLVAKSWEADISIKQDKAVLQTAAFIAANNGKYLLNGTFTVTDISSPNDGFNYEAIVVGGVITVGGVSYVEGDEILRIRIDGAWKTYKIGGEYDPLIFTANGNIALSTTTVNGRNFRNRVVIITSTNNQTITIDNDYNCEFILAGSGTKTFVEGAGRTLVQVSGTLLLNGAPNVSKALVTAYNDISILEIINN